MVSTAQVWRSNLPVGDDARMPSDFDMLRTAADLALAFAAEIDGRAVTPTRAAVESLTAFDEPLPDQPCDVGDTIQMLASLGGRAAMGSAGAHYYGFVNGATYPAALGASFLVSAWDQNAALPVMSPIAAKLHEVSRGWLIDVLGLRTGTEVAFVTGATVANASCLAAARDALLLEAGWDVQRDGLFGATPIQVVLGAQAHSTLSKSLGLTGLGRDRVTAVPADEQGRMRADLLPDLDPADGPILVCAQAGEVNTGAFDPFSDIADWATERGAWLHVDGAFGLWALADPTRHHLVEGLIRADSLATDGHKWLNVTYDCGIVFMQRVGALRRTFAAMAGYLPPEDGFEAMHHTPQSSQRARQVEVWAVLRTLGRDGIANMVQQASASAVTIADRLRSTEGFEILNDVVLNQVLVRYRSQAATEALVSEIQRDGRIWCGPTRWQGETAMRISVSSWKTTPAEAERDATIITECANRL
jgi:glutamate/tyrosine decarboxylase-like PLP-dependent enzyme